MYTFGNTGYSSETELQLGTGYWLRFDGPESVIISGTPVDGLSISLMEGWNMISGISNPIMVDYIMDPDNLIIPNTIYGFSETGYSISSVLNPGYGYWLRSSDEGEIQLSSSNRAKTRNTFENKLRDAHRILFNGAPLFFGVSIPENEEIYYSLPPRPPVGGFDARFTNNMLITENNGIIEVSNNKDMLNITFNFNETIDNGLTWQFVNLKTGEHFTLTDNSTLELQGTEFQF